MAWVSARTFLVAQLIDLLMEQLDLELRLDVDSVVVRRFPPVYVLLAVLSHHDDWCGVRRLERERQV